MACSFSALSICRAAVGDIATQAFLITLECSFDLPCSCGGYCHPSLFNNLGILAQDGLTSWKSALWFWNVNSNCHTAITSGQGFGATIQAINGALECIGKVTDKVNDRINHYTNYCSQFGVNPGNNPQC